MNRVDNQLGISQDVVRSTQELRGQRESKGKRSSRGFPPKPYAERSSVARLRTHMLDHPANRAPSMLRLAMRETHPLNKPWELGPCATLHVGTAHAVSCPTDLTPHFTLTLTRV
jgi:hypothetical protein